MADGKWGATRQLTVKPDVAPRPSHTLPKLPPRVG